MSRRTLSLAAGLALSLSACQHDDAAASVDQDTTLEYDGYASGWTDCWQSFTAGRTGSLTAVRVWAQLPYGVTLTVYEGEGTSGSALATTTSLVDQGGDVWEAALTDIPSSEGAKYTVRLTAARDLNWIVGTYGYAGGVSNVYGADADFGLTTYVLSTRGAPRLAGQTPRPRSFRSVSSPRRRIPDRARAARRRRADLADRPRY